MTRAAMQQLDPTDQPPQPRDGVPASIGQLPPRRPRMSASEQGQLRDGPRGAAMPQPQSASSGPLHTDPVPEGVPPHASSVLVVDLDAIRTNYRALRIIAGKAECAGVVKADGYGLGLERVVRALLTEGCRTFFVANIDEAWRTRQQAPEATIYVLNGLYPGSAPAFADLKCQPVLNSVAEAAEWAAFCGDARRPAALHVDTGMNRLGFTLRDLQALRDRGLLERLDVSLVVSHLASGDSPGSIFNTQQRQAFEAARQLLPGVPASLANSAGTLLGPAYHLDIVRPGIAVYGGSALQGIPNPMKGVVRLLARILQVREVSAGETIGYGQSFTARHAMRLAVVAAGYADGFPRAVTGQSDPRTPAHMGPRAFIDGYAAPVVGRVSMDLIALDATNVPPVHVVRGHFAEMIGAHTRIDDIATAAGTIGYEILTRLGRRSHRVYLGG